MLSDSSRLMSASYTYEAGQSPAEDAEDYSRFVADPTNSAASGSYTNSAATSQPPSMVSRRQVCVVNDEGYDSAVRLHAPSVDCGGGGASVLLEPAENDPHRPPSPPPPTPLTATTLVRTTATGCGGRAIAIGPAHFEAILGGGGEEEQEPEGEVNAFHTEAFAVDSLKERRIRNESADIAIVDFATAFPLLRSLPAARWWSIAPIAATVISFLDCAELLAVRVVCEPLRAAVATSLHLAEEALLLCASAECRQWRADIVGLAFTMRQRRRRAQCRLAAQCSTSCGRLPHHPPFGGSDLDAAAAASPPAPVAAPAAAGPFRPMTRAAMAEAAEVAARADPHGTTCELHSGGSFSPAKAVVRQRETLGHVLRLYDRWNTAVIRDFALTRVAVFVVPPLLLILVACVIIAQESLWTPVAPNASVSLAQIAAAGSLVVGYIVVSLLQHNVALRCSRQRALQHQWHFEESPSCVPAATFIVGFLLSVSIFQALEEAAIFAVPPLLAGECAPDDVIAFQRSQSAAARYPPSIRIARPQDWYVGGGDGGPQFFTSFTWIEVQGMAFSMVTFDKGVRNETVVWVYTTRSPNASISGGGGGNGGGCNTSDRILRFPLLASALFTNDDDRRAYLDEVAGRRGRALVPTPLLAFDRPRHFANVVASSPELADPLAFPTALRYFSITSSVNVQLRLHDAFRVSAAYAASGLPLAISDDLSLLGPDGARAPGHEMLPVAVATLCAAATWFGVLLWRKYHFMLNLSRKAMLARLVQTHFVDRANRRAMEQLERDRDLIVDPYPPHDVPEESDAERGIGVQGRPRRVAMALGGFAFPPRVAAVQAERAARCWPRRLFDLPTEIVDERIRIAREKHAALIALTRDSALLLLLPAAPESRAELELE